MLSEYHEAADPFSALHPQQKQAKQPSLSSSAFWSYSFYGPGNVASSLRSILQRPFNLASQI